MMRLHFLHRTADPRLESLFPASKCHFERSMLPVAFPVGSSISSSLSSESLSLEEISSSFDSEGKKKKQTFAICFDFHIVKSFFLLVTATYRCCYLIDYSCYDVALNSSPPSILSISSIMTVDIKPILRSFYLFTISIPHSNATSGFLERIIVSSRFFSLLIFCMA